MGDREIEREEERQATGLRSSFMRIEIRFYGVYLGESDASDSLFYPLNLPLKKVKKSFNYID